MPSLQRRISLKTCKRLIVGPGIFIHPIYSCLQAWHLKLGQYFFRRSLKISASVKSNEFTNPFIIQNYKSNTIFKSFDAIYHRKNYPTISIAYSPITQLTFLNNQYSESKFYSLTSGLKILCLNCFVHIAVFGL